MYAPAASAPTRPRAAPATCFALLLGCGADRDADRPPQLAGGGPGRSGGLLGACAGSTGGGGGGAARRGLLCLQARPVVGLGGLLGSDQDGVELLARTADMLLRVVQLLNDAALRH